MGSPGGSGGSPGRSATLHPGILQAGGSVVGCEECGGCASNPSVTCSSTAGSSSAVRNTSNDNCACNGISGAIGSASISASENGFSTDCVDSDCQVDGACDSDDDGDSDDDDAVLKIPYVVNGGSSNSLRRAASTTTTTKTPDTTSSLRRRLTEITQQKHNQELQRLHNHQQQRHLLQQQHN